MKSLRVACFMAGFCFLVMTGNVFAVAIGPYVDLSSGSGEFEYDNYYNTIDIDTGSAAIGFALDTAPTNESVFNYRLNVGIAREDIEDNFGNGYEMTGLQVENVFGFAFIREPKFRWWAGPSVGFGFYGGESEDGTEDVGLFQLGIGAATGFNIKAGENVIIAPSVGFRITGASGTVEEGGFEDDFSAGFTTGYVNLAILFN